MISVMKGVSSMDGVTKIKVGDDFENTYKLYSVNEEFSKRANDKMIVYDLENPVFKEDLNTYYFVDPTTLTMILKSINGGSMMPHIGFKKSEAFFVNTGMSFGWGTSMNAKGVEVLGLSNIDSVKIKVYIFDTIENAQEYYNR